MIRVYCKKIVVCLESSFNGILLSRQDANSPKHLGLGKQQLLFRRQKLDSLIKIPECLFILPKFTLTLTPIMPRVYHGGFASFTRSNPDITSEYFSTREDKRKPSIWLDLHFPKNLSNIPLFVGVEAKDVVSLAGSAACRKSSCPRSSDISFKDPIDATKAL
ncbi:MAG: hypothetical protein WCF90_00140 [Methanomicrobiales archaeon]